MPSARSDTSIVIKDCPKTVRFLPYDLVPNLDTSSRLFRKAQAVIAKQAAPSSSSSSVALDHRASLDRLFNLNQGESYF